MGFHQDPGLVHLVFLDAQNLPQRVHLPAHVFEHLVDGVDLDLSLLEAFHGEANGHVLRGFHEQRRVGLFGLRHWRPGCSATAAD